MPDLVLPSKKSPLKSLAQSVAEIPLFWYLTSSRWFFDFLKNFLLVGEDRLSVASTARLLFTPLLLGALFLVWLAFPPLCLYHSLRHPAYLSFLVLAGLGVLLWRACRPRFKIAEVKDRPVIQVADITTRGALRLSGLDSVQFLTTAHRLPRLAGLLQRLEVVVPLPVSGGAVQIFRDQRVWEIAVREAFETGSDYVQPEHLFFGVLGFEEMKGTTAGLGIKIEDLHEAIKWRQRRERPAPVTPPVSGFDSTLEALEYKALGFEKDRGVIISFPALTSAIKLAAEFFPDRPLPDKALELLDEACSRVVKVGGDFVGSSDVARLVSEKNKSCGD